MAVTVSFTRKFAPPQSGILAHIMSRPRDYMSCSHGMVGMVVHARDAQGKQFFLEKVRLPFQFQGIEMADLSI
jgi:hypothetical protein